LKTPLHGKHFHLTHFKGRKKKKKWTQIRCPKLMLTNGYQKLVGGEKLGGKVEGDQAKHLRG
jgi:hypothetical protein